MPMPCRGSIQYLMKWKRKMRKTETISKILKLKDNKKKEIELEVKKAADRVDDEKSKLRAIEKDYNAGLRFFNEKNAEGSLTVNNIASYYDFFTRINSRIDEQKKVHKQVKNELTSLKNTLVNAHRDKKMFEILSDKAIKRDKREKALSEQKEADFFMIARKLK
ncbi:MAG TPA: flagellar export protein FliJ [Nitrospirae bacterium]|nr:flagellar export protein FliJ [Nitrospirota bacterium]HDZ00412.1 flagellar export protein FliJ [Nitrospirota bacterium]